MLGGRQYADVRIPENEAGPSNTANKPTKSRRTAATKKTKNNLVASDIDTPELFKKKRRYFLFKLTKKPKTFEELRPDSDGNQKARKIYNLFSKKLKDGNPIGESTATYNIHSSDVERKDEFKRVAPRTTLKISETFEAKGLQGSQCSGNEHFFLHKLDVNLCVALFSNSLLRLDDVELHFYLEGFEELMTIPDLLNPDKRFKIAQSELRSKLNVMYELIAADKDSYYFSMKSMVKYERDNKANTKPNYPIGCRTYLRLCRSLKFLIEFWKGVRGMPQEGNVCDIAVGVYKDVLSTNHSWMVRKSASMLLNYSFPSKDELVKKVFGDYKIFNGPQLTAMIDVCNEVLRRSFSYFKLYNLLDLP